MITYETYKTLHIFSIVLLFTTMGLALNFHPLMEKSRGKILAGLFSFFILVSGMGLIARLGFRHDEPFPLWIRLIIVVWVLINALLVLLLRTRDKTYRSYLGIVLLLLALFNIWAAIYKPL